MRRIGLAVALALSLILAPLASAAQQAKAPRVGVLMSGTAQGGERLLHELREGLRVGDDSRPNSNHGRRV